MKVIKSIPFVITFAILLVATATFILIITTTGKSDLLKLTHEEEEWIVQNQGKISISGDPNYPPLLFFDTDSNFTGLINDYIEFIEKDLQLSFRKVKYNTWQEVYKAGRTNEIDVIAGMSITPERLKEFYFSQPIIKNPAVIFVKSKLDKSLGWNDLNDKRIAITHDYAVIDYLLSAAPDIKPVLVESDKQGIQYLSMGEVDVFIGELPTASYYISQMNIPDIKIAGEVGYTYNMCFATRDELPHLHSLIEKSLASMSKKERDKIRSRWITIRYNPFLKYKKLWSILIISIASILGLVLFVKIWNRSLFIQVRNRTQELEDYKNNLEKIIAETTAELRSSKRMLQEVLDTIPTRVFWKDRNLKYLGCNKRFALDADLEEPDEIIGKTDYELPWKDQAELYRGDDKEVIESQQEKMDYEEPQTTPSGETIWLTTTKVPLKNTDNETIGILGTYQDITERKKAESALMESEKKFRTLADTSPSMISIQTMKKYIYVNIAWEKFFGYKKEEATRMSPEKVIDPEMKDIIHSWIKENLEGKEVPARYDLKVVTKEGSKKWLDHSVTTIEYEGEMAYLSVANDITELRETRESLLQSEKELKVQNAQKDKLFSIIAHDLISPLSSIIQVSDLIKERFSLKTQDDKECYKYIDHLEVLSQRAHKLTENLLLWGRSQLNTLKLKAQYFDLYQSVIDPIELVKNRALQKDITISNQVHTNTMVFADQYSIQTILRNLISNAIKFTGRKGKIVIEADKSTNNGQVFCSVSDTGIGIPESLVKDLFSIEESNSRPGTEQEMGTGLGLILCKELIEKNNGEIWVESRENVGTTFFFSIPAKE